MKISVKLKYTEMQSLVSLTEVMLTENECTCRNDAIIALLMMRFYKKLKEKTILLEPRNYTFQITQETALAFVEFFSTIPVNRASHAGNIVDKLIQQFDQQTAHMHLSN